MNKVLLHCLWLLFSLLVSFPCSSSLGVCEETEALLSIRDAISNFNQSWWNMGQNCCDWVGVQCGPGSKNGSAVVVSLALPGNLFRGRISEFISNLTYLRSIDLSGNSLSGPLPLSSFSALPSLESLDLSGNNLSGSVTTLITTLGGSLRLINVSNNPHLGGGRFSPPLSQYRLQTLSAAYVNLDPSVVENLCLYIPSLETLDLSGNNLSGPLPESLGNCTSLLNLDLSHNNFTGSIPFTVLSIPSLRRLSLSSNSLSGILDPNLGYLLNLTDLDLSKNQFNGSLPLTLSNLTNLTTLSLDSNRLHGPIHLDCTRLPYLKLLDLNSNSLNSSIPANLAECTALEHLNLAKNDLTGEIPDTFNQLQNLSILSLSSNQLNGSLHSLKNCTRLVSLILTKNQFVEAFPEEFGGFRDVQILALGFLGMKGTISPWLRNCTKLQMLDLSWNSMSGQIPTWLGDFRHLFYVELSNNSFTGAIPPELFRLQALVTVDDMVGLKPVPGVLAVKRQGDLPDLRYNQLSSFPPSIYLSHNHFSGVIPWEVGFLQQLLNLDLSNNNLTGPIPESLGNASQLQSLDLSWNGLSGGIPSSLALKLTFLAVFNVSHNNLSGMIPTSYQFSTFANDSYLANPYLCGLPLTNPCREFQTKTPPSSMDSDDGSGGVNKIAIFVPVALGLGLFVLFLTGLLRSLSKRHAVYQGSESSREMNIPRSLIEVSDCSIELFHSEEKLTVGDLFKATNDFNPSNIVGCGGFGLVFRADLANGAKLAIKKLSGDCGQLDREFRSEVQALSKAQHENLVPLRGFFQVGNERLLIYSYMENGSLDYWLHERCDGSAQLDWSTRLKIAQGSARGLAYLHQICNPHIVHRDIKSSNILLDEKFEAHLADFGLARLMTPTDTHVTTELVGTLGYIPPEYSQALNATLRGDIYSFGVVLLELLTGKRPIDVSKGKGAGDLLTWVYQLRREGRAEEAFDCDQLNKTHIEQMLQVLDVACLCINQDPLKRPGIKNIVCWLDQVGEAELADMNK